MASLPRPALFQCTSSASSREARAKHIPLSKVRSPAATCTCMVVCSDWNCMADAELLAGTMLMALVAWQHDTV